MYADQATAAMTATIAAGLARLAAPLPAERYRHVADIEELCLVHTIFHLCEVSLVARRARGRKTLAQQFQNLRLQAPSLVIYSAPCAPFPEQATPPVRARARPSSRPRCRRRSVPWPAR